MSEVAKKNFISPLLDKLRKIKHLDIILIVLFIAIILLIYFSSFLNTNEKTENNTQQKTYTTKITLESYEKSLINDLESLISSMSNAGSVKVMLLFEEGIETEIAYIIETKTLSDGTKVETKSPVLISTDEGQSEPIILQEILPKPISVIVVASGAKDTKVKMEILRLTQAMFSLPASKIEIFA